MPFGAGAPSAANAVHVVFRHFRQVVVDHVADAADINAAGGDVGRDQQLHLAGAQLGNGAVALILVQVAVQRRGRMPLCVQLFGQPVGAALGGGEDQDLSKVAVAQYVHQQAMLVFAVVHMVQALLDLFVAFLRARDLDAPGVFQQPCRELGDIAFERGGK